MALQRRVIDIPLATGMDTKSDPRAMQPPGFSVCRDVEFDDVGGVQTRPQYQPIADASGNTLTDIRRVVNYDGEMVAFSKDKIWSYASGDGSWVQRSEYLAVETDEQPVLISTSEQVDADRAEMGGVVMYCWNEVSSAGNTAYVAALDAASGAVLMGPEIVPATSLSCRLVATDTRIVLAYISGNTLNFRSYDPASLIYVNRNVTFIASIVAFDLVADEFSPADVVCVLSRSSAFAWYYIARLRAVYTLTSVSIPRESGGSITIAVDGSSGYVCVSRALASGQIRSDMMTSGFVLTVPDRIVGTSGTSIVTHLTSSYGAPGVCSVAWSQEPGLSPGGYGTYQGSVTNAGAVLTGGVVIVGCALVSRAFTHDGAVYAWVVFDEVSDGAIAAKLQNTYYLFRLDGLVVARAVANQAASRGAYIASVQETSAGKFAWASGQRGVIPLGGSGRGYSATSVQDCSATFDSNRARRVAFIGRTMYIAGANLSQYDGIGASEVGFYAFPWFLKISPGGVGVLAGAHNWKQSFAWKNAKGEIERSTTATIIPASSSMQTARLVGNTLNVTSKKSPRAECSIEFWRQMADAPVSAPFYLASDNNPAATGGNNRYVRNNTGSEKTSAFVDNLSDAALASREVFPENGGLTLASLPPPPATIIKESQYRIILAGIAGHPHRVVYSMLRGEGEVVSFNDFLYIELPPVGGAITALEYIGETMVVFKERAVYALPGNGYDNNGGGMNYGPTRLLSDNIGAVSAETVAITPRGVIFKSDKGWQLLDRGWGIAYIGGAAAAFDSEEVVAVCIVDAQQQVRFTTPIRTLVWDYYVNQWADWSIGSAHALMWNGSHHVVNSGATSLLAQSSTHSGTGDLPSLDIETGWLKFSGFFGFKRARRMYLLGKYLGPHAVRIRVAYDYDTAWADDRRWVAQSVVGAGGPLRYEHRFTRQKCQAIKIRITSEHVATAGASPTNMAIDLTSLTLLLGIKSVPYKGLAASHKG